MNDKLDNILWLFASYVNDLKPEETKEQLERAKGSILELMKEAFEAGRSMDRVGQGLWTKDEYTYKTFNVYIKPKL